MRDGVERTVPVNTVVPGDLILLSAGNLIPADGLVIEAEDFLVSEASMTGESFPVEKQPGTVKPEAALSARTNAVFLGASVQSGTAKVLVVETGRRTAFGAIAARLRTRPLETDFARGVRQFGYLLIRAMVVIVLFVLTVNLLLGRPVIESLLFAVALAVGMSPELLPAIVRDSVRRRPGHEPARRHRPPPRSDREPRQHGYSVHRQDRYADGGHHRSQRRVGRGESAIG
jgi:Mg2+-importing ATPase